jgi:hypothetical protein
MNPYLFCLCLLLSGILPLAAQGDSGGEIKREAGRSAWFACTDLSDSVENPVKVMGGKDLTELKLEKYMASDPVKIPKDGVLRIVRAVPDPANQGKTKYLVLAEAKIPENVREALIILAPLAKPEGDLIFQAKVQDLASFKGGDRLYINLSDTDIGVQLGDTPITIPAKQSKIYSAPKLAEPANMPIMYKFYHPEQKKWKLLSASTVVVRPTRREICIFNSGTRLGNIKNHKILFPVQMAEPREEPPR